MVQESVLEGGQAILLDLQFSRHPGCLPKTHGAISNSRSLGWHGRTHKGWSCGYSHE